MVQASKVPFQESEKCVLGLCPSKAPFQESEVFRLGIGSGWNSIAPRVLIFDLLDRNQWKLDAGVTSEMTLKHRVGVIHELPLPDVLMSGRLIFRHWVPLD